MLNTKAYVLISPYLSSRIPEIISQYSNDILDSEILDKCSSGIINIIVTIETQALIDAFVGNINIIVAIVTQA